MTSVPTRLSRVSIAAAAALAAPAAAIAQAKTMARDDWVQTSAISWSGGVRVASGDVKGGTAPAAGGEHEIEMDVHVGKTPTPRGPGALTSAPAGRQAKEMDHAPAKLAQFAINGNSPGPCRVGARYPTLRLDDGRSRWVLTNVAVVGCGGGGMTVSYAGRSPR